MEREQRIVVEPLDASIGLALMPDHTSRSCSTTSTPEVKQRFPFSVKRCRAPEAVGSYGFGHPVARSDMSRESLARAVERSTCLWEDRH